METNQASPASETNPPDFVNLEQEIKNNNYKIKMVVKCSPTLIERLKIHVYAKRKTRICTT